MSEEDGVTPYSVYFPYHKDGVLSGYKARILNPKKMWAVGEIKECDLFGWQQAIKTGAKKLFITGYHVSRPTLRVHSLCIFVYGTFTLYRATFQTLPLTHKLIQTLG